MHLPQTLWKKDQDIQRVFLALAGSLDASSSIIRFTGGCVRNWILEKPAFDIDCATSLSPEKVIERLQQNQISFLTPGLSHGTVTALFKEKSLEITTLRRDIFPTGRHATVVYTDSWEEDAQRRDFTINGLFCDWTGQVYDYVGGVADLQKGFLRFVGDPEKRIQEDYLRILRFFRFSAFYGKHPIDPSLLKIIHRYIPNLSILSRERIHQEFFKLLQAPFPLKSLKAMDTIKIFPFLCSAISISSFFLRSLEREEEFDNTKKIDALSKKKAFLRFLILLLPQGSLVKKTDLQRLLLSKKQQTELFTLLAKKEKILEDTPVSFSKKDLFTLGIDLYKDYLWLKAHVCPHPPTKEKFDSLLKESKELYPHLIFPLSGQDLISLGISPSPTLGQLLQKTKDFWLHTDCTGSKEECLAFLTDFLLNP